MKTGAFFAPYQFHLIDDNWRPPEIAFAVQCAASRFLLAMCVLIMLLDCRMVSGCGVATLAVEVSVNLAISWTVNQGVILFDIL